LTSTFDFGGFGCKLMKKLKPYICAALIFAFILLNHKDTNSMNLLEYYLYLAGAFTSIGVFIWMVGIVIIHLANHQLRNCRWCGTKLYPERGTWEGQFESECPKCGKKHRFEN
jgi:hypothetical protein